MAKSGVTRQGKNKKLHSKLIKQKKDKKAEAKILRLARLKELNALAKQNKLSENQ